MPTRGGQRGDQNQAAVPEPRGRAHWVDTGHWVGRGALSLSLSLSFYTPCTEPGWVGRGWDEVRRCVSLSALHKTSTAALRLNSVPRAKHAIPYLTWIIIEIENGFIVKFTTNNYLC